MNCIARKIPITIATPKAIPKDRLSKATPSAVPTPTPIPVAAPSVNFLLFFFILFIKIKNL